MIRLYFILLAILLISCDCYIAQAPAPPPITDRFLFIFNGESNSGGAAYDSLSNSADLLPQPQVQILNNSTFSFETLDIGTNNTIDHYNMPAGRHGWELNLSKMVAAETNYYGDTVYLVKTGQGLSRIDEWAVTTSDTTNGYIGKFKKRLDTAQYKLKNRSLKKVIFLSIGLNDIIYGGPTATSLFKSRVIQHIATMRAITGANTPVIMTKFFAPYTNYDSVIDSIANNSGLTNVYSVSGSSAPLMDNAHWNDAGLKIVSDRMLAIVKSIYP